VKFRLTIRLKIFLIIAGILITTAVLFQTASVFVLEEIIRNNIKDELKTVYFVYKDSFDTNADQNGFFRGRDRQFGGFSTILASDLTILFSNAPRFAGIGRLPRELYLAVENDFLKSKDGFIIYSTDRVDEFVKKNPSGSGPLPGGLPVGAAPPPSGEGPYMVFLIGRLDEEHLVFMEKPTDNIREGIDYASDAIFVTIIFVLLTGLAVAVPISFVFTKPIYRIKKKAEAVADLDFKYSLKIRNKDEFGELASTMNYISEKLEDTLGDLQSRNDQLRRLSHTDALTGLANRLKIDSFLDDELYKAENRGVPFSVIMIDIDHFKEVNDLHGHQEGDRILVMIGDILKKNSRQIDLAGRWGGEEFIIILPDTGIRGASAMAEKLRRIIENTDFGKSGRLTASFGAGEYEKGLGLTKFIENVDRALYHVKENGRNAVMESVINCG